MSQIVRTLTCSEAARHQLLMLNRTLQATLRMKVTSAEASLDQTSSLTADIRTLEGDIEEKKRRLDRARQEIKDANFDERLSEKSSKARALEDRREDLNGEIRTLSLQADSRARLDIKRAELKSKRNEMQNMLVLLQ